MVDDPVPARYASALFELAKHEGRLDEACEELEHVAGLIRDHEELRQLLLNPHVEAADKLSVLDRLGGGAAWSSEVRAFVQMVLALDRAALLLEIADAFGELVDNDRGLIRVLVRTAHPLSSALRRQLTQRLEQLEHRTVELTEETAPELIGGIQVLLDHRILDGSLHGKLAELRQRLKSVRVH